MQCVTVRVKVDHVTRMRGMQQLKPHVCVCVCVLFEFVGRTIGASPKEIYQSLILLFFIHWWGDLISNAHR